jgi:MFS family permease
LTEPADVDSPADPTPEKVTIRVIVADPAVRVAFLVIFVAMLGFGIVAPILPLYARSFGVSYETTSWMISAFAFARLLTDPVAGPLVERFGERMVSMTGVVTVGVSAFLTAFAPSFAVAVLLRAAGGVGSSLLFTAVYSYLLKVVPSERMGRTFSLFYGSLSVGVVAGAPLGGIIASWWGLASPLIVYSALCFCSGALYLAFLKDPEPAPVVPGAPAGGAERGGASVWRTSAATIRALLRSRAFVLVLALNFTFFWVVAGGYDTMLPLFAREGLDMSTVAVGAVFAIAVFAEMGAVYPAGVAADRFGRKRVLIPGLLALATMMTVVGWATTPIMLGILTLFLGLSSGSVVPLPASMLADLVGGASGTAVGVFRFFGDLGFVIGPLVGGAAAEAFGFRWAFAIMAAPLLLVVAFALRVPETLRRDAGEPRHPLLGAVASEAAAAAVASEPGSYTRAP